MKPATLFEKLWAQHLVAERPDGLSVIHIDRHVMHEVTSPQAFSGLELAGRPVRNPELTFATQDHIVSTEPGRGDATVRGGQELIEAMRANARRHRLTLFDLGDRRQGIVHVIAPELGLALPGLTLACGDSHTCTIGALGALAWGIGTSEVEHILATQTALMKKPRTMRIRFEGRLPDGVGAKDMILHLAATIGTAGATGRAVEFAGEAVRALDMEGRMTLCNMGIEIGARFAMVAPDDCTFAWLAGRPYVPQGRLWDEAVADWRRLPSDIEAHFDDEIGLDVSRLTPQVSWGTSPEQTAGIDAAVPDPAAAGDAQRRSAMERALAYMGLVPGMRLDGLPIDKVFIGSCTNSRLGDLRAAARVLKGRRVASGVRLLVVPGSSMVRQAAEAEGLDRIFVEAGAEWREPGCSMCAGLNADKVAPGERCVSTSNRNFEGRQGPNARTHLVSPAMAAAAAVAGRLTDVRRLEA